MGENSHNSFSGDNDQVQKALVPPAQILVVEDETEIRELISLLLLRQGHRVQQSSSAFEAQKLIHNSYDLIILDWMMPQMSGIELLKKLTADKDFKTPVLMVTAKSEPADIVLGLESGADDYISKPFEPSIFLARVKALLRRSRLEKAAAHSVKNNLDEALIHLGDLTVNMATYEVKCQGQLVHLTPSEFKILSQMATNQGRVLTRDGLVEVVQGEGISVTGRTIDTHVFGLRKKMGPCGELIETIRGVGYRVKSV